MSPKAKLYKKEYAFELFKIAKDDFYAAEFLTTAKKIRAETIIYMAQQAVEKAVKAYLCFKEIPIAHTHEINVLLEALPINQRPDFGMDFSELTQFATLRRYEEGPEVLTVEDVRIILDSAKTVLTWVEKSLK